MTSLSARVRSFRREFSKAVDSMYTRSENFCPGRRAEIFNAQIAHVAHQISHKILRESKLASSMILQYLVPCVWRCFRSVQERTFCADCSLIEL